MSRYGIGTQLKIEEMSYQVIGYIVYQNPADSCSWIDYRLRADDGEFWLSVDEHYGEYSLSWPANSGGNIGPEWKKVDEGEQIVIDYAGSVDVDMGEKAGFVEYEDDAEEKTLSMEIWEDGTEVSQGYYLDLEEIKVEKEVSASSSKKEGQLTSLLILFIALGVFVLPGLFPFGLLPSVFRGIGSRVTIADYLKESASNYQYLTSITGKQSQKAQVYKAVTETDIAKVTEMIIQGIEGETENVTQNSVDTSDQSISIVTENEYALVYRPEEEANSVYVQVSDRKYVYSTDQAPYKAGAGTDSWYRSHYYSSSYTKDSQRFKDIPSSYSMYNGPIVHDLGNGYFDSYASSIRQSNIGNRHSAGGGTSFGK